MECYFTSGTDTRTRVQYFTSFIALLPLRLAQNDIRLGIIQCKSLHNPWRVHLSGQSSPRRWMKDHTWELRTRLSKGWEATGTLLADSCHRFKTRKLVSGSPV